MLRGEGKTRKRSIITENRNKESKDTKIARGRYYKKPNALTRGNERPAHGPMWQVYEHSGGRCHRMGTKLA